jgi:hypothetical protein
MLTRILAALGLQLGDNLYTASDANNPHGYWEHAEIGEVQEELQIAMRATWFDDRAVSPLPVGWLNSTPAIVAKRRLISIVDSEVRAADGLWGFKDPRTLRYMPMWQEIFAELGIAPSYVLAIRNPAGCVASLMRRDGLDQERAELLWIIKNTSAAFGAGRHLAAIVDFNDWFVAPSEVARGLHVALGLPSGPLFECEYPNIADLVDQNLDHAERSIVVSAQARAFHESILPFCVGSRRHITEIFRNE